MLAEIILIIILLFLIVSNVFSVFRYLSVKKEFGQTKALLEAQKTNEKVLEFTKLFIEKVLKSETEVNFETRLKLENAVRDINDEEILIQWQKFTESKTEKQSQDEVKNLLETLVNKIKTNQ